MHKVMSITSFAITRSVELKNMQTNVVEACFDDSAVVSDDNFDFMQVGKQYECKIKLFGKIDAMKDNKCLSCRVVDTRVHVGKKEMVEVLVDNNSYYIARSAIEDKSIGDCFFFYCTRKDLIQVDSVLHADYR